MPRTDLVLINPGTKRDIYQSLHSELTAIEPPVWAGLLATFIEKKKFSVRIVDANAENLLPEETAARALSFKPGLIAVIVYGHNPSASTQVMPAARAVCLALKHADADCRLILAGGHVAALPERTLAEESVDFVCDGEGPVTLLKLLEGSAPVSVPDLWYREDGKARRSEISAPLIQNLESEMPGPAWHLLPMKKYRAHNWHAFGCESRAPYAAIYTTLGCPYRCEFCCIQAPFKTGEAAMGVLPGVSSYRFWSPASVLAEIDLLVKTYGVRNIKIADEMFVLNAKHVGAICDGLIRRDYGLNLWAYARVDTAKDPELLKKMRAAGFRWLVLGIEAADSRSRKDVEKNFSQEDIFESVRKIRSAGIHILANYIFGLPEDDEAALRKTYDLSIELNTEFANFYCAMAYPGSALYKRALREGWALPENWSGYSQHSKNSLPCPTLHLSAHEVLSFRDKAFLDYFNRPEYHSLVKTKFGERAVREIISMNSHRLERQNA